MKKKRIPNKFQVYIRPYTLAMVPCVGVCVCQLPEEDLKQGDTQKCTHLTLEAATC